MITRPASIVCKCGAVRELLPGRGAIPKHCPPCAREWNLHIKRERDRTCRLDPEFRARKAKERRLDRELMKRLGINPKERKRANAQAEHN